MCAADGTHLRQAFRDVRIGGAQGEGQRGASCLMSYREEAGTDERIPQAQRQFALVSSMSVSLSSTVCVRPNWPWQRIGAAVRGWARTSCPGPHWPSPIAVPSSNGPLPSTLHASNLAPRVRNPPACQGTPCRPPATPPRAPQPATRCGAPRRARGSPGTCGCHCGVEARLRNSSSYKDNR